MKKIERNLTFSAVAFVACSLSIMAFADPAFESLDSGSYQSTTPPANSSVADAKSALRVGIVNTKKCLEESKLGKQEQANFERIKNQMESVLRDKEKTLEEIESKLNDDDYMDSISEETASELKRKKRNLKNEGMQLQSQYMQTLQQANMKIIQNLTEIIGKASAQVAQDTSSGTPVDIIFTDEACTYYSPSFDVSDRVVAKMNALFAAEQKDNSSGSR